ncbi:head completion/stabilization protein [Acinetobacter nectaris]|uniref:head completion/stabilization protein n=1 Tax=Acinetobacter nectaris TaxID=1219382 RepID=UPI001F32F572|nr:head completion/stabilization protein [Acinetobacter nectaris]MCF9034723.1 head completion/stabilization protein [Acinetobacter nectaris]
MSFVANGTAPQSNVSIASSSFFPTIGLDDIRHDVRIDGAVPVERVKQVLLEEIIDVNRLLSSIVVEGQTLADLAVGTIDGKPETEILYFSAISSGVAAKIAERYRSYDSTNSGNKRADEMTENIHEYRRNKVWAIQQLKGENHTVVELI